MNRARSVGGKVRDPAAFDQPIDNRRGPVAEQMGAINQHDARATFARRPNALNAFGDRLRGRLRALRRRRVRIDKNVLHPAEAFPLRQRINLQLARVDSCSRSAHSRFLIAKYHIQQRPRVTIIRDHDIRADAQQPLTLPRRRSSAAKRHNRLPML